MSSKLVHVLIIPVRSLMQHRGNGISLDEKKALFLQKIPPVLTHCRSVLWGLGSISSLWSRSACGSSWGLWGGEPIKINSAGLLLFLLLLTSWKAPSGGREVACRRLPCCCVKAAGKLNKQQCLFITKRRGDKETRWEHYLQVLWEQAFAWAHENVEFWSLEWWKDAGLLHEDNTQPHLS